jgi:hypothetical protein
MRIWLLYCLAATFGLFAFGPIGAVLAILIMWLVLQVKILKNSKK